MGCGRSKGKQKKKTKKRGGRKYDACKDQHIYRLQRGKFLFLGCKPWKMSEKESVN